MRSVFPKAQLLAISATVSKRGQDFIKTSLKMEKFVVVAACPSRDNVSLTFIKKPPVGNGQNSYRFLFEPLILELKHKGEDFPLTIVYCCGNIDWLGYGYQLAIQLLGEQFYVKDRLPENARVAMFHASIDSDSEVRGSKRRVP